MPFIFEKLSIPDVVFIRPKTFEDDRGHFAEIYKSSDFEQFGILEQFVQVNKSRSIKDVVRGLHYQLNPIAQGKLVQVLVGEIFDVVVDIRKGSPYYGEWVGKTLSSKEEMMLYVPEGFAHGFCVLSDIADVLYYCTKEYESKHERGIIWNDPRLQIEWPISGPILSKKDSKLPVLEKAENNFTYG